MDFVRHEVDQSGLFPPTTFMQPTSLLLLGLLCVALILWGLSWRRHRQAQREWRDMQRAGAHWQAVIHHEVRTPLSALSKLLELALDQPQDRQQQLSLLRSALHAATALQILLDDLLVQHKMQSGHLALQAVPCDLALLLTEMQQLYTPIAASKQLTFSIQSQLMVSDVMLDCLRFRQILQNLLSNAVKCTEHGGIELQASTRCTADHVQLDLRISDTGAGMPAGLLQALDQPFHASGEAHRQQFGGHGLGLFLSRQLVRLMQGDMTIHSHAQQGTTILLRFPLQAAPTPATGNARTDVAHLALQDRRILLVEDEPAHRMLLTRHLTQLGAHVTGCADGRQALEIWKDHVFDVLLLDWHLPGLSGPLLCRQVRRIERRQQRPQRQFVIGMTAGRTQTTAGKLFDAWLSKPVEMTVLAQAIRQGLTTDAFTPLFDLPGLRKLLHDDQLFTAQFLSSAAGSIGTDLQHLHVPSTHHDAETLAATLHHLLGVLRLLCPEALSQRCQQLEKAARMHDTPQLMHHLPSFRQDIQALHQALVRQRPRLLAALQQVSATDQH